MDILLEIAPEALALFIAALLAVLTWMARRWFGITIDAKRADRLHEALRRAAIFAVDRFTDLDPDAFERAKPSMRGAAADYMREFMPDTLRQAGVDGVDKLDRLIVPHLREAEENIVRWTRPIESMVSEPVRSVTATQQ